MSWSRLPRLMMPMLMLVAVGCVSDNKNKIEGSRWTSEAATIKSTKPGPGMGKSVTLRAGHMELHFHQDGSLYYIIAGKLHAGKYSLGAGSSVTLTLDEAVAGSKVHRESITINGSRLTMTDSDGTSLTFTRVN